MRRRILRAFVWQPIFRVWSVTIFLRTFGFSIVDQIILFIATVTRKPMEFPPWWFEPTEPTARAFPLSLNPCIRRTRIGRSVYVYFCGFKIIGD